MRRWIRPLDASMPPSRIATGMMASGIVPGEERDQDAGIAVAGGERGVGVALDRRDLEHAGKPGKGAAERGEADDQRPDRQALQLRGADIAAGDARGEAPGGLLDQDPGDDAGDDADGEAPVDVHAGHVADAKAASIGAVDGLLRLAGSRSGPSTIWFISAMAI